MGRGNGKQNQQHQVIHIEELEIENKVEIDSDMIAEAIVKAKQIEKRNDEQAREEKLAEWRKTVGYKEHDDKKGLRRALFRICNRIKVIFKIMFISRKKHLATSPTSAFIQSLTAGFFYFVQFILTVLSVGFIVAIFYHPGIQFELSMYFMCGVCSLISFMLSRIFRLMAIEIEQTSNREQVLGVFTAVMSVIPLVEKIVELFKGVG